MAHIHTEPGQVDHTVSFFVLRLDQEFGSEPRLTFHRHRKSGKLQMFGGHVELNETPWGALLHELTEESGFERDQLAVLQPTRFQILELPGAVVHPQPLLSSTGRYPFEDSHYHSDSLYVLTAREDPRGEPEEGESTEIHLLSRAELEARSAEDIVPWCREVGIAILERLYPLLLEQHYEELPLTTFSGELPEEAPISAGRASWPSSPSGSSTESSSK